MQFYNNVKWSKKLKEQQKVKKKIPVEEEQQLRKMSETLNCATL